MDPNATLKLIFDAHTDGDLETQQEAFEALQEWFDHSGFDPDWNAHPEATQVYQEMLQELTYA